ncbi:MAG: SdrD B-like domain-containing protein [Ferruginibacter sp.]
MKKLFFIAMGAIALLLPVISKAQSYINFSKYAGGSGEDKAPLMRVVNGETYLLGNTTSPDLPVTNGSVYMGGRDMVLTKYSSTGAVIYSTYIGGNGDDILYQLYVVNNEVYVAGSSSSSNYPVTNGSVFAGVQDIVVTKLNAAGNISFSTYIGGNAYDGLYFELLFIGNDIYISGRTESTNFPVTGGTAFFGASDIFIVKMNATTGAIILAKCFGGNNIDFLRGMSIENGFVYIAGTTYSNNLPLTIGTSFSDPYQHIFVAKLNASDLSIVYSRYLAGNSYDEMGGMKVLNGEFHLSGWTMSSDFPVTNGTTLSGIPNDADGFYTRLNPDGSIGFSTYIGSNDFSFSGAIQIVNGEIFLQGSSVNYNGPSVSQSIEIRKLDLSGNIIYTRKLIAGDNVLNGATMYIINGEVYLVGLSTSPYYPVTNGSQYYNGGTGYFTHLDASGNIVYSTFLGKMDRLVRSAYINNQFYILGTTNSPSYPVTDNSTFSGARDNIVIILKPDGTNVYSGYTGGLRNEDASAMDVLNTDIFFSGTTASDNYPVTDNVLFHSEPDMFLTKLSFCPTNYSITDDTLSPKLQTVCKYGLAQTIIGKRINVPADSLPTIFLNGVATGQQMLEATYQWQIGNTINGPWTDIPSATYKDYTPIIGAVDQYYRRIAFAHPACGGAQIHISDTATVMVNSLIAPTVNAGGPFNTCPGSAVTIGGSPTVSGGNPPYTSYQWDMGAGTAANPVVSPNSSTIYTLIVTDNLGCRQIGQSIVFTYKASAGPDKSNCAGTPVKIGALPISGVPGIVYDWQPPTSLTSNSVAQPFANPVTTTDYILTLTVPKTGGGTCITKDTVRIIPVAAPVTVNFAGPEQVICLGDIATIGTPPEPGFNYVWSPGSYLTDNTSSTTTYYPGNLYMPTPNTAFINLTAQKDGCSFSDQVEVTTIESRAGLDGCGPRYVGLPDRTPNVNETYQWTLVSGPGSFTGATDQPQVPVSASVGGTSVYGLLVSYHGGSCYDEVVVPEQCDGCGILIFVYAEYKCPSFGVNNGNVTLEATSNIAPNDVIYTWSPQVGLSNYTGAVVHLTDNVPRTYTVTATSISDPTFTCSSTISVNDPAYSAPVFGAPDVFACADSSVTIGLPPVAGYTYEWTGTSLSNNFISNPVANVSIETDFPVEITDGNGCVLLDTVTVLVQNVHVDAGEDWVVCNNAVVTLGTPAQPFTTYVWEPQSSPWQNGTNQFSAQPQVLIATDITFTVTATTSAGCITSDDVQVTIDNTPTVPDQPDALICTGNSIQIGSPALPGVIYQWTPATGLSNPSIAQPVANPTDTTVYSLLAIFPGACALPATDEIVVNVSSAAFNMPDKTYCPSNGAVQLGTAAPAGMGYYHWEPQQLVTDPNIANPATLTPPPNVATMFTLAVVNAEGCFAMDTITITPSITAPIAGPDKSICINTSTTIGSASNTTGPGITYSWSPATNLNNAAAINPVFTGSNAGVFIYILTKTDNNVSCVSKDTMVLTVIDHFLPAIPAPVVCRNSCVQIGTTAVTGIQYLWTPATGLSSTTVANPVACVDTATMNYSLIATDANGCKDTANVIVGVNALPAAQLTIPTVNACVGDTGIIFNPVINPPGNYSYLWSPDNGTLSNVNIPDPHIATGLSGINQYTLQVTDDVTGCSNSAQGTVIINACSTVSIVGNFAWFDNNINGLQDIGELGVSNMGVKLYNSLGFNVATAITGSNGYYSFSGVQPGNDYYVVFNPPAGYTFTTQNVGGIAANNNSKADLTGRSNNFNVIAGVDVLNIDAGIKPVGSTPITLLSFNGILQSNQTVLLNWQTTAELNNHYFDVERSSDGINFFPIGRVNGNGTTALPHNYSLIDEQPMNGINYYRLKQVDFDGQYTFSHIVRIRVSNNQNVVAFYNSQSNSIIIRFNKQQNNTIANLYAANGQLVKTTIIDNATSYSLQLPVLAKGVYMLQIRSKEFVDIENIYIAR